MNEAYWGGPEDYGVESTLASCLDEAYVPGITNFSFWNSNTTITARRRSKSVSATRYQPLFSRLIREGITNSYISAGRSVNHPQPKTETPENDVTVSLSILLRKFREVRSLSFSEVEVGKMTLDWFFFSTPGSLLSLGSSPVATELSSMSFLLEEKIELLLLLERWRSWP